MAHTVVIVGLGRIGMGYDLNKPPEFVLSHARAFAAHDAFRLAGGVDSDGDRRAVFADRFAIAAFSDVESAMRSCRPDVVVVATPTETHVDVVSRVLAAASPRALLCEKPMGQDVSQAREIVNQCQRAGCALYVNYMRRSDPMTQDIRRRIDDGSIETPIRGVVWYSRGLHNSASHFVNLCRHLLGDAHAVSGLRRAPDPDFSVRFDRGDVYFIATGTDRYFHNSVELIAQNGRLRYERGGAAVFWSPTTADPVYPAYVMIDDRGERLPGDFSRMQWHVIDQLARALGGHAAEICSGTDALRTHEVLSHIEERV